VTVAELATEVAQLLNDAEPEFEHIRWSRAELIEYANDAVVQIAMLRPDTVAKDETVALKPGARQELPEGGTRFQRVEGTFDRHNVLQGQPFRMDTRAARIARTWFAAPSCPHSGDYVVTAFAFDPANPRVFFVEPPVPPDPPVKVIVSLARVPQPVDENEALPMDRRFHNAVIAWMLYRAFSKDQDSAPDAAHAANHLRHFYEMLGLSQRADERYYGQAGGSTPRVESDRAG